MATKHSTRYMQEFDPTPLLKAIMVLYKTPQAQLTTHERTTIQARLVWKLHHCAFKCAPECRFKSNPPTPPLLLKSSISLVFDKSNVERLQSLHLPPSPRVSPTGQLEVDCQLVCRTIDNHLLPLLLHTSTHKHVNKSTNTHTHRLDSPTKLTGMKCSTADLSPCSVSVCARMPAWALLHQNTLNRARITDASVQQVCKALRQVWLRNTAVTAKVSAPWNSWCVEMFWVTSHGGRTGWHNAQRTTAPFLLAGINQCLVSQLSNGFPTSHDCLF